MAYETKHYRGCSEWLNETVGLFVRIRNAESLSNLSVIKPRVCIACSVRKNAERNVYMAKTKDLLIADKPKKPWYLKNFASFIQYIRKKEDRTPSFGEYLEACKEWNKQQKDFTNTYEQWNEELGLNENE
jgi:hypothetical protein